MKKINKKIIWSIILGIGILYILNLGFGLLEIVPDNIPIFGNLDEGVAGILIAIAVEEILGLNIFRYFK